jgi:nucleoside-diphosphate kinase
MIQRTLSIVKPDGVGKGLTGEVIRRFEQAGLRVVALKMVRLDAEGARGFYHVHGERPFFESLVSFMTSGPIVPMVVEGEDAIDRVRKLMGATDPVKAEADTIRKEHASSIEKNIVHGSDAPATASFEICYFFSATEIQSR